MAVIVTTQVGGGWCRARGGTVISLAACALWVSMNEGPSSAAQRDWRPSPETYHWLLPAHHEAVEVVELHPGDCYVIRQVDGLVYFGDPLPGVAELQRHLGDPLSHRVEDADEHPECTREGCLEISRVSQAITTRVLEEGDRRVTRRGNHRPSPLDNMRGGAYSDVGSDARTRFRQTPEQRMAYLHLLTASRENCYEARVPRMLTIHIRDRQYREDRTGFYSGYLYLEHHHAPVPGRVVQRHSVEVEAMNR